jgi:hypothetical protein
MNYAAKELPVYLRLYDVSFLFLDHIGESLIRGQS